MRSAGVTSPTPPILAQALQRVAAFLAAHPGVQRLELSSAEQEFGSGPAMDSAPALASLLAIAESLPPRCRELSVSGAAAVPLVLHEASRRCASLVSLHFETLPGANDSDLSMACAGFRCPNFNIVWKTANLLAHAPACRRREVLAVQPAPRPHRHEDLQGASWDWAVTTQ